MTEKHRILAHIKRAPTPSIKKERIMNARRDGLIDDAETEDLIVFNGLQSA